MFLHAFRPRVLVYGAILGTVAVALLVGLALRHPFRVDVVRDRASLARLVDEGRVENVYRLQIMNATEAQQRYRVGVGGQQGLALAEGVEVTLGPAEARWVTVAVRLPPEDARALGPGAHPIAFTIESSHAAAAGAPQARLSEKSTFVVPR